MFTVLLFWAIIYYSLFIFDTWSGLDPAEKNQIECPHLQRGGFGDWRCHLSTEKGGSCLNFDVQNHIFLKITKYLFKIIPWRSLQPQAVDSGRGGLSSHRPKENTLWPVQKKLRNLRKPQRAQFFLHRPKGIFLWPMAGETSTARVHGLWLERPPWDYFK